MLDLSVQFYLSTYKLFSHKLLSFYIFFISHMGIYWFFLNVCSKIYATYEFYFGTVKEALHNVCNRTAATLA